MGRFASSCFESRQRRGSACAATAAVFAAGLVSTLSFAAPAHAELIATDHFLVGTDPASGEYLTSPTNHLRRSNVNGGGQDPTVPGFSGAWSGNVFSGSLAVAQWQVDAGNIEPLPTTEHYSDGGRARFAGNSASGGVHRRVQRALDTYTASDTYYMSFLSQVATTDAFANGFVGMGFTNDLSGGGQDSLLEIGGADGMRGLLVGVKANGDDTADLVLRHRGRITPGESAFGAVDEVLAANIENVSLQHVVVKLEVNAAEGVLAGNDIITVWVNPTDISSEEAASAATTPLSFFSFTMVTNEDLKQLTLAGIQFNRPASFDEPRLATSWEGAVGVIPEPATMVLLGVGVAGLLGRRR